MTIVPVGFAQVVLRFTGVGFPTGAQCVFGVDNAGAATAATIGARVSTAWQARLRAQTMTGHNLVDILVKLGPQSTGATAVTAVGLAGTQAGALVPPQVAFLIRKNTALGGKAGRGRMYYPSLGEAFVDDAGNLGAGVAAASSTAFNLFRTDLATAGSTMVLLHADGSAPTTITSLATQAAVATQRNRVRR